MLYFSTDSTKEDITNITKFTKITNILKAKTGERKNALLSNIFFLRGDNYEYKQ